MKSFEESTWQRVKQVDAFRRSQNRLSKCLVVKIPEVNCDNIGYHRDCYNSFTVISIPNVLSDEPAQTKPMLRSDIDQPMLCSFGIFPPICLFCGHKQKSKDVIRKRVLEVVKFTLQKRLSTMLQCLDDREMSARISGIDMITKEVKYHHSCRKAFLNNAASMEESETSCRG